MPKRFFWFFRDFHKEVMERHVVYFTKNFNDKKMSNGLQKDYSQKYNFLKLKLKTDHWLLNLFGFHEQSNMKKLKNVRVPHKDAGAEIYTKQT